MHLALTAAHPPPTIGRLMTTASETSHAAAHPAAHRVAFLGFSDFERTALASYFRLASESEGRYEIVFTLTDADFLVADADHAPSVQLVLVTERQAETVFIGSYAPPGAAGSMRRPIDALQVIRALDALAHRDDPAAPASPAAPSRPATAAPGPGLFPDIDLDLGLEPQATPPGGLPAEQGVIVQSMLRMPAPASAAPVAAPLPDAFTVVPPEQAVSTLLVASGPTAPPAPEVLRSGFEARSPSPAPVPAPSAPARKAAPGAAPRSPDRSALAAAHRTPRRESPAVLSGSAPALVGPPAPARALLVDDSAVALRFLTSKLLSWDVRTDTALHSDEALEKLAQRAYDFVFLDLELGPASALDGLALCRFIKRSELAMSATVVMVSAHHSEIDRARGSLAGCDGFLGKPLNDVDLAVVLRRHGLKSPDGEPKKPLATAGTWPA